MTFQSFYEVYKNNLQNRLRENTWQTKSGIVEKKILPYFGSKCICDILKTIHNQLSAIFNHAIRFYGLPENPAAIAGNMGKEKAGEVIIWMKEEYRQFSAAIKDRPASFIAFEILYWRGLRLGELLALTPRDFDFEKSILVITKSYQRIGGKDIILIDYTNIFLLMKLLFLSQRLHLIQIYQFCFLIIQSSILTRIDFMLMLLICGYVGRTYHASFKQFEVLFREV